MKRIKILAISILAILSTVLITPLVLKSEHDKEITINQKIERSTDFAGQLNDSIINAHSVRSAGISTTHVGISYFKNENKVIGFPQIRYWKLNDTSNFHELMTNERSVELLKRYSVKTQNISLGFQDTSDFGNNGLSFGSHITERWVHDNGWHGWWIFKIPDMVNREEVTKDPVNTYDVWLEYHKNDLTKFITNSNNTVNEHFRKLLTINEKQYGFDGMLKSIVDQIKKSKGDKITDADAQKLLTVQYIKELRKSIISSAKKTNSQIMFKTIIDASLDDLYNPKDNNQENNISKLLLSFIEAVKWTQSNTDKYFSNHHDLSSFTHNRFDNSIDSYTFLRYLNHISSELKTNVSSSKEEYNKMIHSVQSDLQNKVNVAQLTKDLSEFSSMVFVGGESDLISNILTSEIISEFSKQELIELFGQEGKNNEEINKEIPEIELLELIENYNRGIETSKFILSHYQQYLANKLSVGEKLFRTNAELSQIGLPFPSSSESRRKQFQEFIKISGEKRNKLILKINDLIRRRQSTRRLTAYQLDKYRKIVKKNTNIEKKRYLSNKFLKKTDGFLNVARFLKTSLELGNQNFDWTNPRTSIDLLQQTGSLAELSPNVMKILSSTISKINNKFTKKLTTLTKSLVQKSATNSVVEKMTKTFKKMKKISKSFMGIIAIASTVFSVKDLIENFKKEGPTVENLLNLGQTVIGVSEIGAGALSVVGPSVAIGKVALKYLAVAGCVLTTVNTIYSTIVNWKNFTKEEKVKAVMTIGVQVIGTVISIFSPAIGSIITSLASFIIDGVFKVLHFISDLISAISKLIESFFKNVSDEWGIQTYYDDLSNESEMRRMSERFKSLSYDFTRPIYITTWDGIGPDATYELSGYHLH